MNLEGVTIEVEQRRGLARAGILALSDLDDEVLADEVGDEVGHGDAGEPGLPGDVGPAELAVAVERLHDERAVVSAGVFGQHLRGRPQLAPVANPGVMFVSKAYEQTLAQASGQTFYRLETYESSNRH